MPQVLYDSRREPLQGLFSALAAESLRPGQAKLIQNWLWGDDGILTSRKGLKQDTATDVGMDSDGLAAGTVIGMSPKTYRFGNYEVSLCAIIPDSNTTTVRIYYRKFDVTASAPALDASWTEATASSGQFGDTRGTPPDYGMVQFQGVSDDDGVIGVIVQFGVVNTSAHTNSGTTTSASTGKLIDTGSTPSFTTHVSVGDTVLNTTDNTLSDILSVDSTSQLTLRHDIMANGEAYKIYSYENVLLINFSESYAAVPIKRIKAPFWGRSAVAEPRVSAFIDIANGTNRTAHPANEAGNGMVATSSATSWGNGNFWRMLAGASVDNADFCRWRLDGTSDFSNAGQIWMLFDTNNDLFFDGIFYLTNRQAAGTTTSAAVFKLIDTNQSFLTTVAVGDRILNRTDSTFTRVSAVDSDTQLSVDADIMANSESYDITRRISIHDPSGRVLPTNPINEMFEVPVRNSSIRLAVFPVPPSLDISAVDGLRYSLPVTIRISENDYFNIYWIAAGGVSPGTAEYAVSLHSSLSKTDSAGIFLTTNIERVNTDGSSAPNDFVLPIDPQMLFHTAVPVFAPSKAEVNNVTDAASGWANRCSIYRKDPDDIEFTHITDVTVASWSGSAWQTDSDLFGGTSDWEEKKYFTDTVEVQDKEFKRRLPSAHNEPVPPGQAMSVSGKRLFVAAFSGVGDRAQLEQVKVSEQGSLFRHRTIPRSIGGVVGPISGYSIPLGEPIRKFFDVSASVIGNSSVYVLSDRSYFALNGPVANRIASLGCIAPESVHEKDGRVFFIDDEMIMRRLSGTTLDLSTNSVDDALDAVPADRREFMVAIANRNRYFIAMADASDDDNYRVLVWNDKGFFEDYRKYPATIGLQAFMQWNVKGEHKIYVMGSDRVVYEFNAGFDDGGTAIELSLRFGDLMGERWDTEITAGECGIVGDADNVIFTFERVPLVKGGSSVKGEANLDKSGSRSYILDTRINNEKPYIAAVDDKAVRLNITATAPTDKQVVVRALTVDVVEKDLGGAER